MVRETGTLEICEAVTDIWQPTTTDKIILNLPATVEYATPNVHARTPARTARTAESRPETQSLESGPSRRAGPPGPCNAACIMHAGRPATAT